MGKFGEIVKTFFTTGPANLMALNADTFSLEFYGITARGASLHSRQVFDFLPAFSDLKKQVLTDY